MVFKWRDEHVPVFLELYKNLECLWNVRSDSYKNRTIRENAYKSICLELNLEGLTPADIKSKIKSIRTVYKTELNKVLKSEKSAGVDDIYVPMLFWYNQANSFLRGVSTTPKESSSNLMKQEPLESEPFEHLNLLPTVKPEPPLDEEELYENSAVEILVYDGTAAKLELKQEITIGDQDVDVPKEYAGVIQGEVLTVPPPGKLQLEDEGGRSSGKEVMRHWKNMGDSYVKCLKNQEGKNGDSAKLKKPYVFHKGPFIQSVCQPRKTSGNMNADGASKTIEPKLNTAASPLVAQPVVKASQLPNKKRKSEEDGFEREIVNILKANMEQSKTYNPDPDEMFFLSQIPLIKTFSPSDKLDFQVKFMQLLQSYSAPSICSTRHSVVDEASTSSLQAHPSSLSGERNDLESEKDSIISLFNY